MKNKFIVLILFIILNFHSFITYANLNFDNLKGNEYINSLYNVELAKVKYVVDGDTLHLFTGGEIIKTRLYGIDCMETTKIHRAYHQAYENNLTIDEIIEQGNNATKELKKIISENNNYVYFKTMGIDKYGRLIAILYDKNMRNINEKLLKTGYCYIYKYELQK